MPDQSNTHLVTFQNRTLRIRPARLKPNRLVVLIHGLTGDENSMWVFARNFAEDYWIVAPRAPYSAEHVDGGYSWWPRQAESSESQEESQGTPSAENLRPFADALIKLIDKYAAENNIVANPCDILGFSQGGVMVYALALLYPERIRRAAILASFIPANAEVLLQKSLIKNKPFFIAHGTLDDKVKIDTARRSVDILKKAGADVIFCEDEVGHKVSAHCLRALEEFFAN